jgi:hypothetical protein
MNMQIGARLKKTYIKPSMKFYEFGQCPQILAGSNGEPNGYPFNFG